MLALGIFAAVFAAYGFLSVPAERAGISRPLAFLAAGALAAAAGAVEPLPGGEPQGLVLALAEVALALVLFTDASRVSLGWLRRRAGVPIRLLGPGMVLAIGIGTATALALFGELDLWECAILATILAPTDAALGAAVVSDERVPKNVRQWLNVEAGLNDGLAVPFLLLFIAGATVTEGFEPASFWATTAVQKIGIGAVVGAAAGALGGELARRSRLAGISSKGSERLALAGVAIALFAITEEIGGSGLIAAFVGGLFAGARIEHPEEELRLAAEEGMIAGSFVFFALGLTAVELFDELTWQVCAYALLSLTAVRIAAVAASLVGSGLRAPTVVFIGWFGPRGLASVVLALIVLEQEQELANVETLVIAGMFAVTLSVFLHGLSAAPLVRRYGEWSEALPPRSAERAE